jgi:Tol biopolymer transport system component
MRHVLAGLAAGLTAASLALGGEATAQEIRKLTDVRFSYPTYTGRGTILYESMAGGNWDLYEIPASAVDEGPPVIRRLTEEAGADRMPAMSPDGRVIAFVSDRGGNMDVWRIDADGGEAVRLTETDEPEIHPYWTPDSRRIVYNRRVPGEPLYAIWIMDADGRNPRELLRDDELNSYAQVSPVGHRLVFDKWWANDESNGEIMLMDLASGELTRLTENAVYDGYPTWFPDGRRVVYSSEVDGVFKLFRMDVDTRETEQLTFGPGDDQRADVSADGGRIVFNRDLDGSIEIYELVLGGGGG